MSVNNTVRMNGNHGYLSRNMQFLTGHHNALQHSYPPISYMRKLPLNNSDSNIGLSTTPTASTSVKTSVIIVTVNIALAAISLHYMMDDHLKPCSLVVLNSIISYQARYSSDESRCQTLEQTIFIAWQSSFSTWEYLVVHQCACLLLSKPKNNARHPQFYDHSRQDSEIWHMEYFIMK